jgi:hypothetical protein
MAFWMLARRAGARLVDLRRLSSGGQGADRDPTMRPTHTGVGAREPRVRSWSPSRFDNQLGLW